MKHPDNDPNKDISELHYIEILQGDAKNSRDKPITAQKDRESQGHEPKNISSTLSIGCENYREMRQHS